jgi:hypothetical protein
LHGVFSGLSANVLLHGDLDHGRVLCVCVSLTPTL